MDDLEVAADMVQRAGALAEKLRRTDMRVGRKSNHSDVVTEADLAAERVILEGLRTRRPHDSILGEEGAAHQGDSGRTWIIDPVDGTWNFLHGLDRWCSALALLDEGRPLLGAIHTPRAAATYLGGPDHGVTRNGASLAPIADATVETTALATYLHPPDLDTEVGRAWTRAVRPAATIRMLGSGSLDLVSVSRGQLGGFIQHSVPDWDWFPGVALVLGLGGAARRVHAGGVEWSVAGAPTVVAQVCAALLDG